MTVVTQSTDCEARYRELVEREAQGEVLTRTDLEDILWEMRLDRDGHDRIAATARTRFHAAARREETAARREELSEL